MSWKQSDLARAASVSTSTIADFERGHRTPVANNVTAIREALEAQGIQFETGGVTVTPTASRPTRWLLSEELLARIRMYQVNQGITSEVEAAVRLLEGALGQISTLEMAAKGRRLASEQPTEISRKNTAKR